jgi:glycine cleavage system H protein
VSDHDIPEDLRYTQEHEWVRATQEGSLRVGITDYAQHALGDVVYVSLPEVGAQVSAGDPIGEVESTKSVADVFAPVSGTVVARNEAVGDSPESVNASPYSDGWLVDLRPAEPGQLDDLLDAAAYRDLVLAAEA